MVLLFSVSNLPQVTTGARYLPSSKTCISKHLYFIHGKQDTSNVFAGIFIKSNARKVLYRSLSVRKRAWNSNKSSEYSPYKSFCSCLTALWDCFAALCSDQRASGCIFRGRKISTDNFFPAWAGKYVPLTSHCGGGDRQLRRLST